MYEDLVAFKEAISNFLKQVCQYYYDEINNRQFPLATLPTYQRVVVQI